YSGSYDNLPVASSSSYATLTTQATSKSSDSTHFPQSSWRSQNYQDSTNMINQPETTNEMNMRSPVKLHPIICWDADKQTYIFSDLGVFPNKAKVVGFIGTKKSG